MIMFPVLMIFFAFPSRPFSLLASNMARLPFSLVLAYRQIKHQTSRYQKPTFPVKTANNSLFNGNNYLFSSEFGKRLQIIFCGSEVPHQFVQEQFN